MPSGRLIALLALPAMAGGCETTLRLEAPEQPIEMALDVGVTYEVVVRPPAPTGALGAGSLPDDPAARERLINRSLDHALVEAGGDRALLFRARRDETGTRFSASHEVTLPSAEPVRPQLQDLPFERASAEGAALAAGQCYFRNVEDLEDVARIHQLQDQTVTALGACPIVDRDGDLIGVVSVNWVQGQTVDQGRAHGALSEVANVLAAQISGTGL